MIGAHLEEAGAIGVAEFDQDRLRQGGGGLQPAQFERGFIERDEAQRDRGVILQVGVEMGAAGVVGAEKTEARSVDGGAVPDLRDSTLAIWVG